MAQDKLHRMAPLPTPVALAAHIREQKSLWGEPLIPNAEMLWGSPWQGSEAGDIDPFGSQHPFPEPTLDHM